MSAKDLKLALEIAAKTTGREDIAAIGAQIETLGPISNEVEQETQALAKRMQELANQREHIAQFNQSKDALTQLELATALSSDRLEKLRQAQTLSVGDASRLAKQEKELTSEVSQLRTQLVQQASAHSLLGRELKQSGVDTTKLTSEQSRLQREIAETANRTVQLTKELTGAGSTVGGFTSRIGSLAGNMTALIGTYFGVQTLKDQLVAMFSSGDQSERLSVQLKAVMGSLSGGKEATAWIQQFAKDTPMQLDEVTRVFVRLKAFGIDPMNGTMQGIVDQAYKLGGGFEEVQGISLALGQAWAKQKLQGEEILQLIERGVPVWEMLEKATGKNTAELQKMSEAGSLGRDTISSLMNVMAQSSAGAAADNMSLLSGLISNAKDNIEKFYRMVADNGALDWLKRQLSDLNSEFDRLLANGTLQKWAKDVSDGVISVGEAIKSGVAALVEWKAQIVTLGQAWIGLKVANWTAEVIRFAGSWKGVGTAISALSTSAPIIALLSNPIVALGVALASTTKLTLDLAKATFDLGEGQEIKNRIAERERENNQQLISQGNQLMAQNGQYKDLQYQTADAIKYMSDADRERYKQSLDGNKNYIAGQLSVNAALEQAGLLTEDQKNKTESATAAMRQAYADFAAGEQQHLAQASKSVNDYVADIQKAKSEAEGLANSSLGDVFKTAGLDFDQISGRVGKTVQTYVTGLQQMEQATSVTGPAINAYLTKAFDSAKNQTELDSLIGKMSTLHSQGKLVGDDYISALGAAANAAKSLSATNSEAGQIYIDLLKQQKAAAEEAYKTTGLEQYKAKVGEINQAIDKATNAQKKNVTASNELEQAFADLGMKSASQLEDLAAKAESAYSRMSSSGASSLAQQKEAFLKYAEAEIQAANASGRLPSAMLQSQAAALGLTTELDALNTKLTTVGGESLIAAGALNQLGDSAKDAGKKVATVGDSTEGTVKAVTALTPLVVGLGAETKDLGKASEYAGMSVKDLAAEVDKQSAAYTHNLNLTRELAGERATRTGDWLYSIEAETAATNKYNLSLAKSTLELKGIQTALAENPSETLINRAEHALLKFHDLGDENLSGLKAAIDSAKQKMDSLTDSVQSGLNSLKDELDELDANQTAIENRRYQSQIDEWQGKLAEARKTGNKEIIEAAREALRLAEEVHSRKLATIKAEQDATKADNTATTTASSSASNSQSTSGSSTTTKTYEIKIGGKTTKINTDATNGAALESILSQLESVSSLTVS